MKSLLCIPPNPADATSFYRCGGPMGELKQRNICTIDVAETGDKILDDKVYGYSAVMLQRPFHESHYQMARMVKECNRPLWIDYDDDLFDIPKDNPTYDQYSDAKVRRQMAEMVAMADVITVTTKYLKDKLTAGPMKDKDVRIVPNAFDFVRFPQLPEEERKSVILWRGSETHVRDVISAGEQLIRVQKKNPRIIFEFLGAPHWMVTERMNPKNLVVAKALSIREYLKHIQKVAALAFVVPLVKNGFNKAKSNIAFLEATFAGSLCIAPDIEEWCVPGCLTYKDPEHFATLLQEVIDEKHNDKATVAYKWVRENRSLAIVNNLREQIIRELCHLPKENYGNLVDVEKKENQSSGIRGEPTSPSTGASAH